VDIPIVVWSLADSLALADVSALPLSFEPDLLATLDIGIDDNSKCRRVNMRAKGMNDKETWRSDGV